jgi:hypothetical protein
MARRTRTPASLSSGSRSEAARPRSAPGGSREKPLSPSPIPVGLLGQNRNPQPRFPGGSDPAEAAPSPGSHRDRSLSGRPFEKHRAEAFRFSRNLRNAEAFGKSPFGSRLRPKASPLPRSPISKAEASSRNPVFGSRLGPGPFPVSRPARSAGRFPRPLPVRRTFRSKGTFGHRHGRFREIPPRIRLRLCGRGFVRLPAFRVPRHRPLGERQRLRPGHRGLWFGEPFPVRRPFRPRPKPVSFDRFAKAESACG